MECNPPAEKYAVMTTAASKQPATLLNPAVTLKICSIAINCPANIAIGTARLGLKSALLSRVGDEQMGRFIHEQLQREGVETGGLKTDKERLTALVLLAVEAEGVSPMIFYRSDCADMALSEEDVDEAFVASSRAIVVTGTHFSRPNSEAAQLKAIRIAKANGRKVAFDIDYRPNLWGLAGHAEGFERYVKSDKVSAKLKAILPDCNLIVGTEEEIMIATGADVEVEKSFCHCGTNRAVTRVRLRMRG